jgi:hypothetical protein
MRGVWGLQIDKGQIGLCWVRRRFRGVTVERGGSHALPPGLLNPSLTEPNIADEAAFVSALRSLREKAGWGGGSVAVALPDLSCRVGHQDFDEMKGTPSEIRQLLSWRMKGHLHFPLQEARIDYQPLPSAGKATRLLYLLARETVIGQYETVLAKAGLEPIRITPRGLALHHVLAIGGVTGKQLFLTPEPSSDLFIYSDGGVPHLWRVVPWEENGTLRDPDRRVKRTVRELHETVTYLEDEMRVGKLDGLVLLGGTEPALAETLKQACRLPIHTVPPPWLRLPADLLPAAGAALLRQAWRPRWKSP